MSTNYADGPKMSTDMQSVLNVNKIPMYQNVNKWYKISIKLCEDVLNMDGLKKKIMQHHA